MAFRSVRTNERDAVRQAQSLINLLDPSARITVDGLIGPQTRGAFMALADPAQEVVTDLVSSRNRAVVAKLRDGQERASSTPDESIRQTITRIAQKHNVHPRIALTIANAESRFNPNAVSSAGAVGLFQLLPGGRGGRRVHPGPAEVDVKRSFPSEYREPPRGDRTDPEWNALVGVLYVRVCARYAGTNTTDASPENIGLIYAYYNMGVGNVNNIRRGNITSGVLNALSQQAAPLRRGNPTDYIDNAVSYMRQNLV